MPYTNLIENFYLRTHYRGSYLGELLENRSKNHRQTGSFYERKAAEYLIQQGYQILESNYYCRLGEIDLIAKDHEYLVFTEVKYRKTAVLGTAAEAVNCKKQQRIFRCAAVYMKQNGILFNHPVRFDVLAIDGDEITLIKNAFGGM